MKDPLILSSIIMSICFLVILLYNIKLKNKIINYSFLIIGLVNIILIIIIDSNFIYDFLKAIITYLWYPNYLIFVIVILINLVLLIISLLNNKMNIINKIINYLLFIISFFCYISFIRLDIDIDLYSSLYQNNSLTIMRIVTISFLIGSLVKVLIKVGGKYEK